MITDHEWVPLLEGARMVARHLSGNQGDAFTREIALEAKGKLLQALRVGSIESEGWRDDSSERERLTIGDWNRLRPNLSLNRLEPLAPDMRRIQPDRILEIVVDAAGVRRLLDSPPIEPAAQETSTTESSAPRRRGPLPKYDWDVVELAISNRIEQDGWPEDLENAEGWRCKADVRRFVADFMSDRARGGDTPSDSQIKTSVNKILDRLRPAKGGN